MHFAGTFYINNDLRNKAVLIKEKIAVRASTTNYLRQVHLQKHLYLIYWAIESMNKRKLLAVNFEILNFHFSKNNFIIRVCRGIVIQSTLVISNFFVSSFRSLKNSQNTSVISNFFVGPMGVQDNER